MTRTIMLIAGEASGDRIASRAVRAVNALARERGIEVSIFGIAGDESLAEGVECLYNAREMSVVGFVEVARRFRFFRNVLREMTELLDTRRPDVLLLIDYPGFNIRLAREAKKRGIRVVYYVSPQVWAWHASRIEVLKQVVDEMLVVFPFEEKLYRDYGLANAHFIGHPLVERIEEERSAFRSREEFARAYGLDATKDWLLVFSGSRTEEVRRFLPTMARAANVFVARHNFLPILVESEAIEEFRYDLSVESDPSDRSTKLIRFRDAKATHELMSHATLGILKSGTTTLEAALLGLPGVICYKTHPISFAIGKRLVKLPYVGLANIVLGRKLYPELLQKDMSVEQIVTELDEILARADDFRRSLQGLADTLRGPAHRDQWPGPSRRVAETLLAS
ncbi:MAG: lipid-A-disaccharide synthase [Bacteroidota bacterium]|nr:lipid-A-disaccharide synthase [Bacteroidota bacterium]MDP4231766.1 lipid-A-disaccharide synthase [Bacteroidota bacterium]MDP4243502.1 lipid-A-disaccharide synthase [Bacteroidota bacterium]MDP4287103.1 lipid-A-disaccharide synthase [Bacteroidota bacterium]